jgi:hypothetical protein
LIDGLIDLWLFDRNCKSLLGYAANNPSGAAGGGTGTGLFTPAPSAPSAPSAAATTTSGGAGTTTSQLGMAHPNSMMYGGFYVLCDEAQEQAEREAAEEEDDPFKIK